MSGENKTIPAVERADKASEAEMDALGALATMAMIPKPRALSDEGLRFPKRAKTPADDIMAARTQDMGIPARTVYEHIMPTRTQMDVRLGTRSALSRLENKPVTMTRCAPDTATR